MNLDLIQLIIDDFCDISSVIVLFITVKLLWNDLLYEVL